MARNFDLFGDPLPENWGKPGRNDHAPTAENANKIRMLIVAKWTLEAIAGEIGVSVPTLRKHYFRNGKVNLKRAKELAIAEVRGKTLVQLAKAADEGNVSAMKEIRKVVDAESLTDLPKAMGKISGEKPEGKKVALKRAAKKATGGWADRGLPGMPH